jgi:hypothetical protein
MEGVLTTRLARKISSNGRSLLLMPVNDSVAQESKKGTAEYARIPPLLHRIKLMPARIMYGTKVSVLGRVCIVVVVVYFVCVQFTLASDMWRGTLSRSATNLQAECPHA